MFGEVYKLVIFKVFRLVNNAIELFIFWYMYYYITAVVIFTCHCTNFQDKQLVWCVIFFLYNRFLWSPLSVARCTIRCDVWFCAVM